MKSAPHSIITFKVRVNPCDLGPMESLSLVGSVAELSFWKTDFGVPLKLSTKESNTWISNPIQFQTNISFEYKFFILKGNQLSRWENIIGNANRRYRTHGYKVILDQIIHNINYRETIIQRYYTQLTYIKESHENSSNSSNGSSYKRERSDDGNSQKNSFHTNLKEDEIIVDNDKESSLSRSSISFGEIQKNMMSPPSQSSLMQPQVFTKNPFKNMYQTLISKGSLESAKMISSSSTISEHDVTYVKQEMEIALLNKQEFVIFATHILPISLESPINSGVKVHINFTNTCNHYCYLADNFKKRYENVFWIGILPINEEMFEYKDKISKLLLDSYKMIPLFMDITSFNSYIRGYCKRYYEKYLEAYACNSAAHFEPVDMTDFDQAYQQHCEINKMIAESIDQVLKQKKITYFDKNTLIVLNDYQLSLVPYFLYSIRENAKINLAINLYFQFPGPDLFERIPCSLLMLESILLCDLVSFNAYESSKEFINCAKRVHNIDHKYEKHGHQMITFLGRNIFIRIIKISLDYKVVSEYTNTPKYLRVKKELEMEYNKKIMLVGIDSIGQSCTIPKIMNVVHNILQKNNLPMVRMVYLVKNERALERESEEQIKKIKDFAEYLNGFYPKKSPVFFIWLTTECTFEERLVLLKNTDIFIKLQTFWRANFDIYEFVHMNAKAGRILCNHSIEYQREVFNIMVNSSLNAVEIEKTLTSMIRKRIEMATPKGILAERQSGESRMAFTKDAILRTDVWFWFGSILVDFKRSIIDQKEATFIRNDMRKSMRFFASHKIYHIHNSDVVSSLRKTHRRVFIFSYEKILEKANLLIFFESYANYPFNQETMENVVKKTKQRNQNSPSMIKRSDINPVVQTKPGKIDFKVSNPPWNRREEFGEEKIDVFYNTFFQEGYFDSEELSAAVDEVKNSELTTNLQKLAEDPLNSVYVVSSLPRELLETLIGHIKNICIFAEDGFVYTYGGFKSFEENSAREKSPNVNSPIVRSPKCSTHKKWKNLCKTDFGWKNTVHGIMKQFCLKTGASKIVSAPSFVSFQTSTIAGDFVEVQAKELLMVLNEVMKDKPHIEVRLLKNKNITVQSDYLPKNYLVDLILYFEFLKRGKIDFFLGLFESGYESVFLGLRKYINTHPEHFNLETLAFFPVKVGAAISHAKYFCEESEVEALISSLAEPKQQHLSIFNPLSKEKNIKILY